MVCDNVYEITQEHAIFRKKVASHIERPKYHQFVGFWGRVNNIVEIFYLLIMFFGWDKYMCISRFSGVFKAKHIHHNIVKHVAYEFNQMNKEAIVASSAFLAMGGVTNNGPRQSRHLHLFFRKKYEYIVM